MAKLLRCNTYINPRDFGALCSDCPIQKPTPIGFQMHRGAKLSIVCESPGYTELHTGVPLTGPTGRWFDHMCRLSNIPRSKLNILNSTCCPMPKFFVWRKRKDMVACCAPVLEHFTLKASARTIMACGQGACKAVVGDHRIKRYVGEIRRGEGTYSDFTVIPNFHPTFAGLRERTLRVHFVTWLRRAWKVANQGPPDWQWCDHHIGANTSVLAALKRIRRRGLPIAVDVESVGPDPINCRVTWVGVGDGKETVSIPWERAESKHYRCEKSLLRYGEIGKTLQQTMIDTLRRAPYIVTQNGMHDILCLRRWVELTNGFDTLRAFSAAAPQTQGYRSLEDLALLEFAGCPRWKRDHREARLRSEDEVAEYNCRDVDATIRLEGPIRRRLKSLQRGEEIYNRLMAQDAVAAKSRARGCLIDKKRAREHDVILRKRAYEEARKLRAIAARHDMFNFNPRSAPQRTKLLFEKLKAKPTVYSELTGAPSLNDKALSKMMSDGNPEVCRVAANLRRFRAYSKLREILGSLRTDDEGVLRATPNVDGTVGERWSYSDPSIQTIPKPKYERLADGSSRVLAAGLRDIFVARPGSYIVELDYDRLELYVVGVLAGDPLIKGWMTDPTIDAHTENALALFGKCDKNLRDLAKRLVYNINYGNTNLEKLAKGAFEVLKAEFPGITYPKVLHYIRKWFEVHHWIATWRANELVKARKCGYTEEPLSGRRRQWYGEPKDTEVYNFPIQTFAGHLTARAVIAVDKHLDWKDNALLFQCHDSLVLEGPDPIYLYHVAKEAMEAAVTVNGETFVFPVGVKVGRSWGSAVECKDEDAIRKVMVA